MRGKETQALNSTDGDLQPPAHGETVTRLVEKLRQDILESRLAPGERLVEHDLTERFGVSRGPVREALRRLAAEGLIEHSPNRGAQVRRLSRNEIRELFEIRIELEALASRLAAASDDEERRQAFAKAILPVYEQRTRHTPGYLEENSAFHNAVMELAGNRQLAELVSRLHLTLLMAHVGDALEPDVLELSVREHRDLAQAILNRDAQAADATSRAHLGRAERLALAHAED